MTTKPESRLQRRIRRRLEEEFGAWFFKVHGNPFQPTGIPDLIGSVHGLFIAIEVKMPGETPKKIQVRQIAAINEAGGYATVVESIDEAIEFVYGAIAKAAKGRKALLKAKDRRLIR